MIKSALIASTILFAAAAPTAPLDPVEPATAEQTALYLAGADTVIAQVSYLEISHGIDGFRFSVTDSSDIFVDFEFPGNLHIRIGF